MIYENPCVFVIFEITSILTIITMKENRMGIRAKILSGFLILATMLLVAGAWSIYELRNIGMSVQKLLQDNYKSIDAAKLMIEALEREDSGILLVLSEKRNEGISIIEAADSSFTKAYEIAQNNITIPGEKEYVGAIKTAYDDYKTLLRQSMAGTTHAGDLNWYFQEVHASFMKTRLAVESLMTLNDQEMYHTASNVESRAYRATMPGVIAIVSAFIFAIIFSYLINIFIVNPVVKLTEGIQNYLDSGKPVEIEIETKDELSMLVSSVGSLIARSSK